MTEALCQTSRALHLTDRGSIERHLRQIAVGLSEYCFANLFLFREAHRYRYCGHPHPFILGLTYDGVRHIMPLFDFQGWSAAELLALDRDAEIIYPLSREQLDGLSARSNIDFNADDSDYLYFADALAEYSAERLRPKRVQAAEFMLHDPCVLPLAGDTVGPAESVLNAWLRDKGKAPTDADYGACSEALCNWSDLGLFGFVVFTAENDPAGFVLASEISQGIAAIHFAKGKRRYPGVFPYMFNVFASAFRKKYPVLNFEQDLGFEGLRQNKRSYEPTRLLQKYRVT